MENILRLAIQRLPLTNVSHSHVEVIFHIRNKIMQYNIFRLTREYFMIIAIDLETGRHTTLQSDLEEIIESLYNDGEVRVIYYHIGTNKRQIFPIHPLPQRINFLQKPKRRS